MVLPTPKPPATTIFTDVMATSATSSCTALELAKSTENPFKQVEVRAPVRVVHLVDSDQTLDGHVGDDTRATPSGIRSTAEISATDRQSRQNPRMA